MIVHVDRAAASPNRKLITAEAGGPAPFYGTVTNADNPSATGTPINKALLDELLAATGVTTGSGTTLALAQTGFILVDGASIRFKLNLAYAVGMTLNVQSTGAIALAGINGRSLIGIPANAWVHAIYSSTNNNWVVQGAGTDALTLAGQTAQQIITQVLATVTDTGAVNAIVANPTIAYASFADGIFVAIKMAYTNTATGVTLNYNNLGVKTCYKCDGTALSIGDLTVGKIYDFTYNATLGGWQVAGNSQYVPVAGGVMNGPLQLKFKYGSLELGDDTVAGASTPYIDFHFGALNQDYNVRLMNGTDGVLNFMSVSGAGQIQINGNPVYHTGNKPVMNDVCDLGEVRQTLKNTLGANYLATNGAYYDITTYTGLSAVDPQAAVWQVFPSTQGYNNIFYSGGYYISIGNGAYFYYSSTLTSGNWTQVSLTGLGMNNLTRVRYVNGYFVACGNGASSGWCAWCATINGTWVLCSSSYGQNAVDVCYVNGKYLFAHTFTGSPWATYVLSATAINGSASLIFQLNGGSSSTTQASSFCVGGGYVAIASSNSVTNNIKLAYCLTSADPSVLGNWTTTVTMASIYMQNNNPVLRYWNGMWMMIVFNGTNSLVYYSATIGSGWTSYNTGAGMSWASDIVWDGAFYQIIYSNSSNQAVSLYCATLTGTWTTAIITTSAFTFGDCYFDATYGVVAAIRTSGGGWTGLFASKNPTGSFKKLPTIAPTNAYAFVRVQ